MKISNYVNEAKRTCVVVLSDCENDLRVRAIKLFNSQYWDDFGFHGYNSYINGPFRGKAKCSPEDEFNEETGLAIARARAFQKYIEAYNSEVDYLIERAYTLAGDLQDLFREHHEAPEFHFPENQKD